MIDVRRSNHPVHVAGAQRVRRLVFGEEQGIPTDTDLDGLDPIADHVVALDGDDVVGTCRVLVAGDRAKLGRMAVLPAHRGQGLAARMLVEADAIAAEQGAAVITLQAEVTAESVYARAGYVRTGEPYEQWGMEHVAMEKRI